jgi:hypothetical protein
LFLAAKFPNQRICFTLKIPASSSPIARRKTSLRRGARAPLLRSIGFAIIGQSALTVASNFATKFLSTDRVNSILSFTGNKGVDLLGRKRGHHTRPGG